MSRQPPTPKRKPRPASPAELRDAIRDEALRLGFDAVGFAPANLAPEARDERLQRLGEFLDAGWQGDMGWLGERTEQRADPQTLWREAKTVVSLAINYAPPSDPLEVLKHDERAAISVYAQGRDYHEVMKSKLKALGRFIWDTYRHGVKVFVDTAPLMEKPAAQAVGHGWQGKHTNLVSRQFGSWLFLGEILLSVELPADQPETDHCGQCRACLDICPTNAIPAPYRLEARRCISYLTIEHEGPIDRELRPLLGNRIYGCDDCLAVCPWNKFAKQARETALMPRPELDAPLLVGAGGARRCRLPQALRRHGDQAHRPRPLRAQRRLCAGQQLARRGGAAGRREAVGGFVAAGARRSRVGAVAPRSRAIRTSPSRQRKQLRSPGGVVGLGRSDRGASATSVPIL